MYKRDIYLDIDDKLNEHIKSVELDSNSRVWHFHLTVDYQPLNLTGKTVKFMAEKPDKTNVLNDCEIIDAENGIVKVELTRQVNAVPGHVNCLLKIVGSDGYVLKTKTFIVEVSKTLSDKPIVSTNEFSALDEALGRVQNIDQRFAETNAQLSQISNETSYLVKKVEDGSDCTNYLKSEFLKAKSRKNTTVLLESGTYHIKSLELLSNMTYTGIGEVVFKSHSSCSSDKWDNACISRGVKNIKINNIIFDGNKEQVPGNGWQGVASLRFEDSSNITVSDCEFRNNFYLNSVFKGCSFVKINNNKYYNSDVGVLFMTKPSNNVDVCYNYFDGGTSEAISIYDIDNTDENVYHHDFNIIGNVIKNKVDSQSIYIKRCYNINVSNNSIDNVGTGIGFVQQDGTDNVSKYANVSNNIINNARFNGIQISYCEESIFTGNTITNSLVYGIDSRNSKEIIVSNNVISETNIGNDNLDTSFMIQFRDAKNITIHSNYMKNSKKLRSCFFASNTNGLVLSNNISNYLDSKFLDLNSTNTTNIDVYNNVGHFPNSPVSIRSAFGNTNPACNALPTVNVDLSWRTLLMPYYDDVFYLASNSESDIINEDFSTGRNARVGRIITIISKTDKIQIQNSVNISLKSSPYKTKIGDTLNFVFDGAKWVQI